MAKDSLTSVKKTVVSISKKEIIIDRSPVISKKFKPNFKEKYSDNKFIYEQKVAEKGIWDRFLEWLSYWFKKIFGLSDGVSRDYVNITLRTIAILIVIYVIYVIVKLTLNKEGQWIFGKSTTKKVISYDDIEQNLKYVDFEKLTQETIASGNYRLAIRYYYLWTLKKMSEKTIIDWHPDKTNTDYLYEIQNKTLKNHFSYLSYLYNYIWYGEFDMDETTFTKVKLTFETALQAIKNE